MPRSFSHLDKNSQGKFVTYHINFNYKYTLCQQKFNSIYSNVIICFILTPFLTLPSQPLLPSPLKLQNFTTQMNHL